MPKAMNEYLQQDMACEGLLECFHGLKGLDREVFEVLADAEQALTVDEIATAIERERSTAYRSIQRLLGAGILQKEQINYDHGGYYHVYRVADSSDVAQHMQRMLNDWYAQMGQLIQEFEDKYEGAGSIEVPP
jgi:predicted transcriptional regulator